MYYQCFCSGQCTSANSWHFGVPVMFERLNLMLGENLYSLDLNTKAHYSQVLQY